MIARTAQRSFSKTENRLENTVSRMCASAADWAGGQGTTPVPSPTLLLSLCLGCFFSSSCHASCSGAPHGTPWDKQELHKRFSLSSSLLSLFKL